MLSVLLKYSNKQTVGICLRRRKLFLFNAFKIRMTGQEGVGLPFIFRIGQRTGHIGQISAVFDERHGCIQNGGLGLRQSGKLVEGQFPTGIGAPSPGSRSGAGGVDDNMIKQFFLNRFLNLDTGGTGAFGAAG